MWQAGPRTPIQSSQELYLDSTIPRTSTPSIDAYDPTMTIPFDLRRSILMDQETPPDPWRINPDWIRPHDPEAHAQLMHMEPVPIHSQQELFEYNSPKDSILFDDPTWFFIRFILTDKEIRADP
ncbi:hypothetical protein PGT21_021420 [Puccinia graminis f. sp. tritici]|uniref:Uncharacterized protein n=1 Tax=Puccinia graminis f. sp. tritici TaxID=56615 RepID=A0A5B0N958_PUCGR|nr:hypothetical protein PGT21_021420 [Puccinia graminis f. sp. tritici]KAA1112122.1 hypothetical protein PGTUg99_002112 [Puccinia graminis f. sp. tritici]